MRLAINDMMRGRLRDLPRIAWLSLAEFCLLALVAVQVARLIWALATPVGAFGTYEGRHAIIPPASTRMALFQSFDPFFRTPAATAGEQVVTSLALTIYGIRVNEGSGLGSAIIATPDGVQNSFAVGDEILPGVKLKSVAFDHVTIDRGGAEETIFLDQSQAAPVAAPKGGVSAAPPMEGASSGPSAADIKRDIGFSPRMANGRVTGLILLGKGPAFAAAGFQPGDILTQFNGKAVGSATDLQALQGQIAPGARISLMVERGTATVPIALTLQDQ
jgi:general secretion pathway protein C